MAIKWSPVKLEKIRNGHKKLHCSSIISHSFLYLIGYILSVINDMLKVFRKKKILFVILVMSSPNLRNSKSRQDLKKAKATVYQGWSCLKFLKTVKKKYQQF